jgi:hypothetical protein
VVGSSPSQHIVTYAEVEAGDIATNYPGRGYAGGPITSAAYAGISVRDLIQQDVGIPIDSVTFAEFSTSTHGPSTLSKQQLGDPSEPNYPFKDGLLPLVYRISDSVGYFAPLLTTGDQPNDSQEPGQNSPLFLTLHTTGSLLTPVVKSSSTTPAVGTSLAFTAAFASPPGTTLTYSWQFGDGGAPVTDAAPTHTYAKAGRYLVSVTVRGADGSYGISKGLIETVGKKAPPTGTGPGTGTGKPGNPATGPNTGTGSRGGGTPDATPTTSQAISGTGTGVTGNGTNTSDLPQITGYLISGEPVTTKTGSSSAAAATAPAARAGGISPVGWVGISIAAVVILLGLGALGEGLPRRRRSTPGAQ